MVRPRPTYRFATETTSRRFASMRRRLAMRPMTTSLSRSRASWVSRSGVLPSFSSANRPASTRRASSTSSAAVSSGMRPISRRYWRNRSEEGPLVSARARGGLRRVRRLGRSRLDLRCLQSTAAVSGPARAVRRRLGVVRGAALRRATAMMRRRSPRPAPRRRSDGRTGVGLGEGLGLHGGDLQDDRCRGVRQRYVGSGVGGLAAVRPVRDERNRGGVGPVGDGSAALRGLRHRNPVWSTTHRRHEGRATTFCVRSVTARLPCVRVRCWRA